MIYAYDKTYLSCAQKNLACMVDYLVNSLNQSLYDAWHWFLTSHLCVGFEKGDCSIVAGKSGIELAYMVLEEVHKTDLITSPTFSYDRSPEYWVGWSLAYYQWATSLRFYDIEKAIPITEILGMYTPYHEMDIQQFVDKMNELYRRNKPETNLKTLRKGVGLSQSQLARQSNVPLRTIQQYEQRQKNINKAQVETLLRLSRVLFCDIEDIIEKVE